MEAVLKDMKILGTCRADCPRKQSMLHNQEDPSLYLQMKPNTMLTLSNFGKSKDRNYGMHTDFFQAHGGSKLFSKMICKRTDVETGKRQENRVQVA